MIAASQELSLSELLIVGGALVAAVGAFVAFPMYVFFLKDRRSGLLRQEVADEARRREQLELRVTEVTTERDALRVSLADERKKTDVSEIAATMLMVAATLQKVVETDGKILLKLESVNGSFDSLMKRLDASTAVVHSAVAVMESIAEHYPGRPS